MSKTKPEIIKDESGNIVCYKWKDKNSTIKYDVDDDTVYVDLKNYPIYIAIEVPVRDYPGGYTYTDVEEDKVSTSYWAGSWDCVKILKKENIFDKQDSDEEYVRKFIELLEDDDNLIKICDHAAEY